MSFLIKMPGSHRQCIHCAHRKLTVNEKFCVCVRPNEDLPKEARTRGVITEALPNKKCVEGELKCNTTTVKRTVEANMDIAICSF